VLEYIPRYGQRLADEVRKWGRWVKEQAEKELAEFYPKDPDGATPIAYLWARAVTCEGPGCGVEVPLVRSLWLAKKGSRSVALRLVPNRAARRVDFEIVAEAKAKDVGEGTVKRGSATCPCCGYTTPVASVRKQLKERRGGAADARLFCVVTTRPGQEGRYYRLPNERDLEAVREAEKELARRKKEHKETLGLVPDEQISLNEIRRISVPLYGMTTWGDLWSPRQNLVAITLSRLVRQVSFYFQGDQLGLGVAVQTCLAMAANKSADYNSSLCTWHYQNREKVRNTFARQAIPMVWDFVEVAPFATGSGNWSGLLDWTLLALEGQPGFTAQGQVGWASAVEHPLPSDSVHAFITDPPYYDAIPYAHLSDFFYVRFRRNLAGPHDELFAKDQSPKDQEIVVDRPHQLSSSTHDIAFYERELTRAFAEGRRVLRPDGIGTIVFASKTTASWEAILQAVLDAGWTITGSWPIDTEMANKVAAQGQARLMSSVHLVCRSRSTDDTGDWRTVLAELPRRIHDWMPRLASEGVIGADAIFACLGPALEIFSRYSRVEKASGEAVSLRDYLEQVWAAVAREALSMIFAGADATGFDPDARLTAMWFWTLSTGASGNGAPEAEDEAAEEDDEEGGKAAKVSGYVLEYDAARKIAQGLGAKLEQLTTVVQVKGDKARLLPVSERARGLFGKAEAKGPARPAKKHRQKDLFAEGGGDAASTKAWSSSPTAAARRCGASSSRTASAATRGSGSWRRRCRRCTRRAARRSAGWTACWGGRKGWASDARRRHRSAQFLRSATGADRSTTDNTSRFAGRCGNGIAQALVQGRDAPRGPARGPPAGRLRVRRPSRPGA
jgi:putative DNA methylase